MTLAQCLVHLKTLAQIGELNGVVLMDDYAASYLSSEAESSGRTKADLAAELVAEFQKIAPVTPMADVMVGRLEQIGREADHG